jgi:hypothetical protein
MIPTGQDDVRPVMFGQRKPLAARDVMPQNSDLATGPAAVGMIWTQSERRSNPT